MSLTHVLGKVPMIQVLDFMLEYMEYDCTVKEIIDHTGVGPTDMKRDFPGLLKCGMVVETRKIGGVQLYKLNTDDAVLVALIDLDNVLTNHMSDKITGEEGEEPEPEEFDERVVPDDSKKYPESEEEWES